MTPFDFFREFVRRPGQTGALVASTRKLSGVITENARVKTANLVVEMGSGTGVCTEAILRRLPPEGRLLAMEVNPAFAAATRRRCPDALVMNDDARRTRQHLEDMGAEHCDAVVSGLPWASFSDLLQDELLHAILDVLRPGGRFVTFAYLQGLLLPNAQRFRQKLARHFVHLHKSPTVWTNLPPAFVYVAEKAGSANGH